MRYIDKKECPAVISDWKQEQENVNLPITYANFREKKELNGILRKEQKHICCYCQQVIDHFQGNNKEGSHNEHLIPQKGEFGDTSLQMEYTNIYACCNYSKGLKPSQQFCGEAKGDKLIKNFIKEQNCSDHFRFNLLGEILPAGVDDDYEKLLKDESKLTDLQKEILKTIKILNLNCTYLVEERKKVLSSLIKIINSFPKDRIELKIREMDSEEKHLRFVDMLLFYMKKKVA